MPDESYAERFWAKVDRQPSGCWVWTACKSKKGYGRFTICRGNVELAHRVAWNMTHGAIPEGMEIDHLCRNRACVNPDHLEPVTPRENQRRGVGFAGINARKTHCPAGHPYDVENTVVDKHGGRKCRTCMMRRQRARNERERVAINARRRQAYRDRVTRAAL